MAAGKWQRDLMPEGKPVDLLVCGEGVLGQRHGEGVFPSDEHPQGDPKKHEIGARRRRRP